METSLTWLGRLVETPSGADWDRLVRVYPPLLNQWLIRAGVPEAVRDDLVQEVLMVILKQVKTFDHRGTGAFRGWLRGILANHIRKFFRDRKTLAAIDIDQLGQVDTILSKQWDREHDSFFASRALRAVEGEFAPATWRAFQMHVVESQPVMVVAESLGLSVNSVLLAKSRVLKRLRTELAGLVE